MLDTSILSEVDKSAGELSNLKTLGAVVEEKKSVCIRSAAGSGRTFGALLAVLERVQRLLKEDESAEGILAIIVTSKKDHVSEILNSAEVIAPKLTYASVTKCSHLKKIKQCEGEEQARVLIGTVQPLAEDVELCSNAKIIFIDDIDEMITAGHKDILSALFTAAHSCQMVMSCSESADDNVSSFVKDDYVSIGKGFEEAVKENQDDEKKVATVTQKEVENESDTMKKLSKIDVSEVERHISEAKKVIKKFGADDAVARCIAALTIAPVSSKRDSSNKASFSTPKSNGIRASRDAVFGRPGYSTYKLVLKNRPFNGFFNVVRLLSTPVRRHYKKFGFSNEEEVSCSEYVGTARFSPDGFECYAEIEDAFGAKFQEIWEDTSYVQIFIADEIPDGLIDGRELPKSGDTPNGLFGNRRGGGGGRGRGSGRGRDFQRGGGQRSEPKRRFGQSQSFNRAGADGSMPPNKVKKFDDSDDDGGNDN